MMTITGVFHRDPRRVDEETAPLRKVRYSNQKEKILLDSNLKLWLVNAIGMLGIRPKASACDVIPSENLGCRK